MMSRLLMLALLAETASCSSEGTLGAQPGDACSAGTCQSGDTDLGHGTGDPNTVGDSAGGDAREGDRSASGDATSGDSKAAGDAGPEPECAATLGGRCFYVHPDGDDGAAGTISAPFKTFQIALDQAAAGDIIYARGGIYGKDNAIIAKTQRLYGSSFAPPCDAGQTEADGYCQVPSYVFAAINYWNGYPLYGGAGYDVASGEAGRPITLRNFPGELPVLDRRELEWAPDIRAELIMQQRPAIRVRRSHWVIRGFEIIGGSIDMGGNIVDITVEGCDIHDLTLDGGDNPGLIRLNRGPEDVRILNNRLHDFYDYEYPDIWDSRVSDAQHFGAVTTLSGETYGGTDDTGAIDIHNNVIYNVPQAFFFKNASRGPVDIVGNHIYDCGRLTANVTANVRFAGNLIHGVAQGSWRQGYGRTEMGTSDPVVLAMDGHRLTMEYNTIVGLEDSLMKLSHGAGHVFQHNVILGFPGTAASANWDTAGYLKVNENSDIAGSKLQGSVSDNNCFIVPDAGFQYLARYMTGNVEHYDFATGKALFGFDANSSVIVGSDPADVFVDPANGNYTLLGSVSCPVAGHTALP